MAHFAARYWDELAKVLAADIVVDDRRRAVNAGIRHGRDAEIANLRAAADVGITYFTSDVIAARGERLILARVSGGIRGPGDFLNDVLGVVEINSHNEIAAIVVFDPDDFDAAIAELDTRYLAGEAGVHPHMWTATLVAYAAINRRELPATTTDFISKDHRRGAAFAPGDMIEYLRAGWDLDHEIYFYPEAVHRLSDLGVVVTHKGRGASREGFDAEWREVMLFTVNGNSFNRCEVFDERDLDTALARFDQLSRPVPRLENAASRVYDRVAAYFAARDWDATANAMAQSMIDDDRRRMVNAGIRRGRDVEVANSQATAAIGGEKIMSTVIATRGERLALCRSSIVGRGEQSGAFRIEFLSVIEIDADERLAAHVGFDLDDFDAALAELDARYLAGEAAAHAHTWSLVAASIAALNRREHPATTPDWVNIDHRRGISFAPGEVSALLANWNATPDLSNSIESVHRLNHLGAVVTSVTHETSQEGFEAEWRGISVLTIEGDLIDRLEVFDEADIDAALARFEELNHPTRRLKNAASQVTQRFLAQLAAGDWEAISQILADDFSQDDRRRVVGAGVRQGRDAEIADLRTIAELGITNIVSTVIATRGELLALMRVRFSFRYQGPEAFLGELLGICQISADERILGDVSFDLNDIDAAIAELDARYLAGEAAAHAHVWSVVAASYAALNRHELPATTPDCLYIDHRRETAFGPWRPDRIRPRRFGPRPRHQYLCGARRIG